VSGIIGRILRAWVTQDGVTHARLKTDHYGEMSGPLLVHGEIGDDLIGSRARSRDGGRLWVLTNSGSVAE
jgi:hypothetical protein